MNTLKSLLPLLLLLVLQIFTEKVKTVHSATYDENVDDKNVDAIDTRGQVENEDYEDNAANSLDDPTRWRSWGHYGGNYHRPSYKSTYYRQNRRRPRPAYRPYRYPYGYRRTFRYRKPKPVITRKPTPKPTTAQPPTKSSPLCREGSSTLDKCQRVCTCQGGKPTNCYRVRKEFTQISQEERQRYFDTVLTVSTKEPYKTKYETLLTIHKTIFLTNIHKAIYFLPWHRWFLLQYENLLREVDCRVTVPYWDWSLVSATPFSNLFWDDTHGFGGNGVGFPVCVRTGPFRVGSNWKVIKSAGGGCLQRNFVQIPGIVPDVVAVAKVLAKNISSFSDFELMLRVNLHDIIHFAIGGTMISADSAAAPEFFAHHAYVDKLWDEWQAKSNRHRFHDFFLAQNTKMPRTPLTSTQLLDNNNLPNCVKVRYATPELGNSWGTLIKGVKEIAETRPEELDKLPRMPKGQLNEKMFEVFKVDKEERKRAREMQRELETKVVVYAKELTGMEKMIGLKKTDIQRMNMHKMV